MHLNMEADRLLIKSLFSAKEIAYQDIHSIYTSKTGTVIVLKDGREVAAKGETIQALSHPQMNALLEKYPVSFKDDSEGCVTYDSAETNCMIAVAESLAANLAGRFVKEHFGQEYDIDVRIVENILGASMEFRLKKDGQVISDMPGYEEADDPSRDRLIDSMNLSFLCKWDAAEACGRYGVTVEVADPKKMEEYVIGYSLKDFCERYEKEKGKR